MSEPIRVLGQQLAQAAPSPELRAVTEARERWFRSVNKPGKPAV